MVIGLLSLYVGAATYVRVPMPESVVHWLQTPLKKGDPPSTDNIMRATRGATAPVPNIGFMFVAVGLCAWVYATHLWFRIRDEDELL